MADTDTTTIRVGISRTVERNYEARGVFPELRLKNVNTPQSASQGSFEVSVELAKELQADALKQRFDRSLPRGTPKAFTSLVSNIQERLDAPARAARREAEEKAKKEADALCQQMRPMSRGHFEPVTTRGARPEDSFSPCMDVGDRQYVRMEETPAMFSVGDLADTAYGRVRIVAPYRLRTVYRPHGRLRDERGEHFDYQMGYRAQGDDGTFFYAAHELWSPSANKPRYLQLVVSNASHADASPHPRSRL